MAERERLSRRRSRSRTSAPLAKDANAAKDRAKAQINHWQKLHKDRLFEVEKAVDVSALMQERGYHLVLRTAEREKPFQFQCDYWPIGR